MNIDEYQKFMCLVDTYLEKRKKSLLKEIRNILDTKKSIRKKFLIEIDGNTRYVEVLSKEQQVKLGLNILNRESNRKYSAYKAAWILFYMTKTSVKKIFSDVDSRALNDMSYEIKNIIKDGTTEIYYKPRTNKKLSKTGEKIAWKKLFRICAKHIKYY